MKRRRIVNRAHARRAASRPPAAARSTSIRRASRGRSSSPRSRGCSRRTTWTRSAATGAARRRRACSRATRSSCTPASTMTSSTITTQPRDQLAASPRAAARRGTARTTSRRTARPSRPIAIKAAGDGEVDLRRRRQHRAVQRDGRATTHYFEGITFRNTDMAIEAGQKGIAGAKGLTVKRSKFENIGVGRALATGRARRLLHRRQRHARPRRSRTTLFTLVRHQAVGRRAGLRREAASMKSFYAVSIYGSGHVMAYNRVRGLSRRHRPRDLRHARRLSRTRRATACPCRSTSTTTTSRYVHDNCFETDGAMRNIRVFRNRCFNAALGAHEPAADLRRAGLFHSQRRLQRVVGAGEDSGGPVRHLDYLKTPTSASSSSSRRRRTCTSATT